MNGQRKYGGYIQWNIIQLLKKEENPAFATLESATLENIMLNKISQMQKDKYCMILLTESYKVKLTATENRMVVNRS